MFTNIMTFSFFIFVSAVCTWLPIKINILY